MIKPIERAAIQTRAEKKLKEHGLYALPVDIFTLLEREDIYKYPKNDTEEGVSGMLIRVKDKYCVVYSTYYHNPGFERFSIAHELGHFFLDDHPQIAMDGLHKSNAEFVSKDRYEQEADIFASGLLMPGDLFKDHLGDYSVDMDGIIKMAELCQTSLTATAIRYVELISKPLVIVISTDGIINYCVVSERVRYMKNKDIPQKGWKVLRNTATAALAGDRSRILNRERDAKMGDLSDWIEMSGSKAAYEEAVGLGRYGKVLTVISVD